MEKKLNTLRIGLFGGSFNPFHKGHLYFLKKAKKSFQLSWIEVMLAYKNPLKQFVEEKPSLKEKTEMLKIALKPYKKDFRLNLLEAQKKEVSYTIDTLLALKKTYNIKKTYNKKFTFYLMIGLDQWKEFHLWKSYIEILKHAHLVVFDRGGDLQFKNFKSFLNTKRLFQKFVAFQKELILSRLQGFRKDSKISGIRINLTSNQKIFLCVHQDRKLTENFSSTLIRNQIRQKKDISKFVPSPLKDYILKKKLYL